MSLQKILKIIKKHNKFLISAHVNVEGDALGSELALARLLKKMGKKAYIVNSDKTPPLYNFLPEVKSIMSSKGKIPAHEVILALDCTGKERLGKVANLVTKDKIIVNIDHHKSNSRFADINWVMPNASSAAEMVYQIYKKLNFKIDKISAYLLYVGILTDTGSFRYSNTTENTLRIAADLLSKNLSAAKIYQEIYENNPLYDMKLFVNIINNLKIVAANKVAWIEMGSGVIKKISTGIDIAENIFNFLRSIKGVEVAIIFKELKPGLTKVNFRSKGRVDVARFAENFGGGGHRSASGCAIAKGLKETEQLVLKRLKKII